MRLRREPVLIGLASLAPGAIALGVCVITHSPLAAFATLLLCALLAAALIAPAFLSPLRGIQDWLSEPDGRAPRLDGGPEWVDAARRLGRLFRDYRRRAEAATAELIQLRSALATMSDGVVVVDASSRIHVMNPAAMAMFGLSEPVEGKTVIEATVNASLDEAITAALTGGGVVTLDLDVVLPDVRRLHAVVSATGGPTEQRAAVAVLHDLTEAQKLERVRRDFVANVSHEMRTPVAGIQAMTESLLSGAMADEVTARRFLVNISRSSQRLVNIVDDLLQLARAESGASQRRDPVPVAPIARDVVAALDPAIVSGGLDVGVEADEDARVAGDAESLRQIISNLVDNAIKYTPAGGRIEVRVAEAENSVVIEVSDTGIGIPAESRDRVFERFYRVDAARSREMGGTGLGLSIVRHLAESMGGAVSVSSQIGVGSTFRVELPSAG